MPPWNKAQDTKHHHPWNNPAQEFCSRATVACGDNREPFTKYLCRLKVGIPATGEGDRRVGFGVIKRLFGPKGENMKHIAELTRAKLRLRGKGSGFLEGEHLEESTDPLMLCVSANDHQGYSLAKKLLIELFETLYADYRNFCKQNGIPDIRIGMQLQEHPKNPRSPEEKEQSEARRVTWD